MIEPSVKVVILSNEDRKMLKDIVNLDREAFGEITLTVWTLESFARFGKVFCLFVKDTVKGFAVFMKAWENPKLAYLVGMAIAGKNRGRGYGSYILSKSLEVLAKSGISTVVLHVDPANLPAMHIYHDKFCFELVEYRENEYGTENDRVFMKLNILHWMQNRDKMHIIPWSIKPIDKSLIRCSRNLSQKLRNEYFKRTPPIKKPYKSPFYGKIVDDMVKESLGPFPEFILPTYPCKNTLRGYCTPCFYSKLPLIDCNRNDIFESLVVQTKYIVDNFDDIVMRYQKREDSSLHHRWDATICYACNGSFFSAVETSPTTRYQSLRILAKFVEERKINMLTYIETCADNFLHIYQTGEIKKLLPMLKLLNAVILCGLESVNNYNRNVIYAKKLSLVELENVVSLNKELGLGTGAFIFPGFHSMTQEEIIRDVEKSLAYLRRLNVMPVLMFPNIQEYTIPHLLYTNDRFNLIDPRTAAYLVNRLLDISGNSQSMRNDCWLTGDPHGGPPSPTITVFSNEKKISCSHCSEFIWRAIDKLRKTYDGASFRESLKKIVRCNNGCEEKYKESIHAERSAVPLRERVTENLKFAEKMSDEYLKRLRS